VETRVHSLEHHLMEGGSADGGGLLVWDVGEYAVLSLVETSDGEQTTDEEDKPEAARDETEQQRLHRAFAARRIRLRLDGRRLPRPYVVNLRLSTKENTAAQARAERSKTRGRKVKPPQGKRERTQDTTDTSESGSSDERELAAIATSETEEEQEEVRRTNAYIGATNSIGSMHQRRWFLSLDKIGSGFIYSRVNGVTRWVEETPSNHDREPDESSGRLEFPFYVRGPEHERSILTGRLSSQIMTDDQVVGFTPRKGWRAILT
jgi:hypothetical protein